MECKIYQYLAICFLVIKIVSCDKLPSYIKPCNRSDPNIKECAIRNGQAALPFIVRGDKQYRLPSMNPLYLPRVDFDPSPDLALKLKDIYLHGFDKAIMKDASFDFEKKNITIVLDIPWLSMISTYDINGKIMFLPLRGSGPANFTILNSTFTYEMDYYLKMKNGEHLMHIGKQHVGYTIGKAHFKFENLFNGDRVLGNQINHFFNDNWKEILDVFGPAVGDTVGQITTSIVQVVIHKVPFEEIFPK